jgi:predicted amidohydrolase
LLRKDDDIFNTLVLAAPDGRTWEYDKLHPWGWERAYFRPGEAPVVADTDLGRLGLAICWDVAHASLFRAYAGQVQMLVASSCPPAMGRTEVCFADGRRLSFAGTSRLARIVRDQGDGVVDKDLRAQAAWLGVPLVSAMQHGLFASSVPRPVLSFALAVLPNPRLWPLVRHVTKATISAPYYEHTLVADAAGEVIARPDQGDSFAVADITIPEIPPRPTLPQPKRRLHPFAYWLTDVLSLLSRPEYDRRVPRKPSTLPHR